MLKKRLFSSWTILVMSQPNKPVFQLKIPKISVISLFGLLIFLFIGLLISEKSLDELHAEKLLLQNDIKQKEAKIKTLETTYITLKKEAEIIEGKMNHLMELEGQLQEVIISLNPESIEATTTPGAMGGIEFTYNETGNADKKTNHEIQDLSEQLNSINESLPKLIDSYTSSLENIEAINESLKAIPTAWPTAANQITSQFGKRSDPFTRNTSLHTGIDIAGPSGTPIYAGAEGSVLFAGVDGGYGKSIIIKHSSIYKTRYAHLSKIKVENDEKVKKGQLIGYMGTTGRSTGVHLHYEIYKHGKPIDPYPYMSFLQSEGNKESSGRKE